MFFALLFKRQHLLRQLPIGFWLARPITCASIFYCSFLIGAKKPPVSSSNSLISSSLFLCRYSIRLSSICPPAFPPQSIKLQSLIHAGSLYAVFCAQKKLPISRKFSKMVEVTGFEPATFWSRTKRATKLRYTSKMEPMKGLEPLTCGLRNRCSTD